MAKHKPGTIYGLRWPLEKKPNGLVRTMSKKEVGIAVQYETGLEETIITDRKTARLLAKRINQCLDDTK